MSVPRQRNDASSALNCLASAASCFCGGRNSRMVQCKISNSQTKGVQARACESNATFRGKPLPYPGMTALSAGDLECVEQRQLYRKPHAPGDAQALARQVVGAGRRCRYGWPQAIVYDPLYREKPGKSFRLGDTTRLTCPLLVKAIDKLEKKGAMDQYNERLQPDAEWHGQLQRINEAHRLLRLELIGDRSAELAEVEKLLGSNAFAIAMRSGLASLRPEAKPDVKCLHAQVADELVRDGGNLIAQQVLRDIEDQGVSIYGSEECCDNCDVNVPLVRARWQLDKCKNNVGKRLSRGRKQASSGHVLSLAGDILLERAGEDL